MEGKMVVLSRIPTRVRKNKKLLFDMYTKEVLREQKFIAEKYKDDYTTCYVCSKDPLDMSIVPSGIIMKPVSFISTMHVLFEITKKKEEKHD